MKFIRKYSKRILAHKHNAKRNMRTGMQICRKGGIKISEWNELCRGYSKCLR